MKIWYQSYTRVGFEPRWKSYEEDLKSHVQRVARSERAVFAKKDGASEVPWLGASRCTGSAYEYQ